MVATTAMSGLIGKLLGQNYRVVEPIGAGAMGMVFVVEHVHLPKRFAAKVLTPDLARHPEAVARFEVEAHAVSQLEHENIVSVLDYGKTDDGCVFIIMELLRGKTLQARIDQGSVSLEEIVSTMIQVCRALAAAHAAGIVHRDMKPDNVFLAQRPGMRPLVKVLDFGVSKARDGSIRDGRITRQGQILGSPEYMSPEASRGEEVDARADVYALGIMLYQLLCGDVPFRHENYLKVLQMHATQAPVPPRVLAPDLSEALERLILRALEKDPALRQSTVEELELELTAAMPEVTQRVLLATNVPPYAPWARSSAHPAGVVDHTHPGLVEGRGASQASPGGSRDGTTLNTRRRPRRAVVVALWGGAVGVAAAGIGLWLDQRDLGGDPVPARASTATVGARAERARHPAAPPSASGDGDRTLPPTQAGEIHLHVDSSPRGAIVTFEGVRLGRTPIDTQVPSADRHGELVLELRGYRTARRSIARDRDGEVRVSLQREVVRRKPQSGRPESSSRRSNSGDGSDRSTDGPAIKEKR
jgi:tRNA A-37 threonylcarbamoyl transferase component Bud32